MFCHECGDTEVPAVHMYSPKVCQGCAVLNGLIDKSHVPPKTEPKEKEKKDE